MTADAKSNADANLLTFRFIDGFPFRFAFGCLPFAIPLPEIRGKVPENFRNDRVFESASEGCGKTSRGFCA
jgi:hypothetical protein